MRRRLTISPEKSAPSPLPRTRKVACAEMVGAPPSPSCSDKPKHVSRKASKTGTNHSHEFTHAEMAKSPPSCSEEPKNEKTDKPKNKLVKTDDATKKPKNKETEGKKD